MEKVNREQHFTEPPPRFNEASLIKRLEEEGIGRPSTYASIISKIQERNYVKKDKNRLVPEDTGRLLNFFLEAYFNKYIEYDYTAKLEENLDDISSGEKHWKDVIKGFWEELSQSVKYAMSFSITEVLDNLNLKLADYLFDDGTGKIQKNCSGSQANQIGGRMRERLVIAKKSKNGVVIYINTVLVRAGISCEKAIRTLLLLAEPRRLVRQIHQLEIILTQSNIAKRLVVEHPQCTTRHL